MFGCLFCWVDAAVEVAADRSELWAEDRGGDMKTSFCWDGVQSSLAG